MSLESYHASVLTLVMKTTVETQYAMHARFRASQNTAEIFSRGRDAPDILVSQ